MVRTGELRCTASPRSSAISPAIEPKPPSTRFSWAPFSIENRWLMLPCARTRNSRCRNDVSSSPPVNSPRTAISKRSAPMPFLMPAVLDEVGHRALVPLRGARRSPGRVDRDLLRQPVDLRLCSRDREHRERADLRDQTRCTAGCGRRRRADACPATYVLYVVTPSSAARAKTASWYGATQPPPRSTGVPSARSWVQTRPPTRSRASTTTTELPGLAAAGGPRSSPA